ncbi:prepilin-type N-terminal cleavage/methylation domain-containing protein [Halorhodospira halochloris]|uniref:Type IV pilus biogenesis protein PilE n=1 Tax=Halorhodospira halochloris TaxID=1052 RepID=A0A0X8XC70_HALHR|nr:type IV pilin protein [Halorhodospira halochloris]MCG5531175.1 prepilin-type N-terminal cleavage/methylation domain-containing protein [Halorhodospira halochloris]BAU57684.1 type IV pilus biogenesis protein PilE [Halorhodospira halochloris]
MITQNKTNRGFTLVEVLIVVGIVAILAAIAYPFYAQYQMRSERSDATGALLATWNELERCFVSELDFTACNDVVPEQSPKGKYSISADLEEAAFKLYAQPTEGGSQEADDECQEFTLDHHGQRSSSPGEIKSCWGW